MKLIKKDNNKWTVEGTIACESCDGTGLYCGMAERDGAAVVCHTCKGTGMVKFTKTFTEFTERKKRKDVKRVFHSSCGYMMAADDVTTQEGVELHFSRYGAKYKDWLNGATPKPMEELYCPYLGTNQEMQSSSHKAHSMYKDACNVLLGCRIDSCKNWKAKSRCWDRYWKLMGGRPK